MGKICKEIMILISVTFTEDYSLLLSLYHTERPNPAKVSLIYLYDCWVFLCPVDGAGNSRVKLQQAGHILSIKRSVAGGWIALRRWMGQPPSQETLKNRLDYVCQKLLLTDSPRKGLGHFSWSFPGLFVTSAEGAVSCQVYQTTCFLEVSRTKVLLTVPGKMAFGKHILL